MFKGILLGLFKSFIWFLIGYLGGKLKRLLTDIRPIKKLWKIKDSKDLIIVAATSTKTDTGDYLRPATGIGQLRALGYSIESLSKAYDVRIKNILLSDDQVQKQVERDMILLGGPKNNQVSRLFLEKLTQEHKIADQDENMILWYADGKTEEFTGIKENKSIKKDYGLIIRTENPFSSQKEKPTICLFTGCHTYGTIAAAKFFTNIYIKQIKMLTKAKKNIFLLVECDVMDGFPVAIKLIKKHEF